MCLVCVVATHSILRYLHSQSKISLLTHQSCILQTACDVELLVDRTSPLHTFWGQLVSSLIALCSLTSFIVSYFSGTGPLEQMWQPAGGVRPEGGGCNSTHGHAFAHIHAHTPAHTHTHALTHARKHPLHVCVFAQTALLGPLSPTPSLRPKRLIVVWSKW